jgi:hypothetical protein
MCNLLLLVRVCGLLISLHLACLKCWCMGIFIHVCVILIWEPISLPPPPPPHFPPHRLLLLCKKSGFWYYFIPGSVFSSHVETQEVLNERASFLAPNSLRFLYLCCNACPYSLVISQPLSYIPSSCLADVIRAVASLYSSSTKTILTRSWLTSHLRVSVPNQLSKCR